MSEGKLDGLYRSHSVLALGGAMHADSYLFSVDGHVFRGWPGAAPLSKFDFGRLKREEPGRCGVYSISNGEILFRWSDGTQNTSYFEPDREKGLSSVEFSSLYWLKLVPWNKQSLQGCYASSTRDLGFPDGCTDFPDFAEDGGLEVRFSPDGHFIIDQSLLSGSRSVAGKYSLEGATLRLLYSERSRICDLYVLEESRAQRQPSIIYINGRPFIGT